MHIAHANDIWRDYPDLAAGVMLAHGDPQRQLTAIHW